MPILTVSHEIKAHPPHTQTTAPPTLNTVRKKIKTALKNSFSGQICVRKITIPMYSQKNLSYSWLTLFLSTDIKSTSSCDTHPLCHFPALLLYSCVTFLPYYCLHASLIPVSHIPALRFFSYRLFLAYSPGTLNVFSSVLKQNNVNIWICQPKHDGM